MMTKYCICVTLHRQIFKIKPIKFYFSSCVDEDPVDLKCVQLTPCSAYDSHRWTPVQINNGSVQLQNIQQPSWCLCYVQGLGMHACNCSDTDSSRYLKWLLKSSFLWWLDQMTPWSIIHISINAN